MKPSHSRHAAIVRVLLFALVAACFAGSAHAGSGQGEGGGKPKGPPPAPPLLKVLPDNPRYVFDPDDNPVYLGGAHVWQNLQEYGNPPSTNCGINDGNHQCGAPEWAYLAARGHNFTRGWHWEQGSHYSGTSGFTTNPVAFQKNGSLYDLETLNPAYVTRLKERIEQAGAEGLYLSIMLFEGFSIQNRTGGSPDNPWDGHPFNPANNSNTTENPDLDGDGGGEELHTPRITMKQHPDLYRLQRQYVTNLVTELNDYDNIIWEICNECGDIAGPGRIPSSEFMTWMNGIAELIRDVEDEEDMKRHLIWISAPYAFEQRQALLTGPADIISLRGNAGTYPYHLDPPEYNGGKVVLLDSDHIVNPHCVDALGATSWCSQEWPWKVFTRGYNPVLMDTVRTLYPVVIDVDLTDNSTWRNLVEETRVAIGQTVAFANETLTDLAAMTPESELCQTGYCLVAEGQEYLVFQPNAGSFWVDLEPGGYDYDWFSVDDGDVVASGSVVVGADDDPPVFGRTGDDWVLHLVRSDMPPMADIDVNCAELTCTFDGSGSTDDHGITGYDWDFGDGFTSNQVVTTHTYPGDDTYQVTLTVTDTSDQTDTDSRSLVVEEDDEMPDACFAATCTTLTCTFDASCSTDDNGIATYSWDFGDGTTSSTSVPTTQHTYSTYGFNQVELTVSDTIGQMDDAAAQILARVDTCVPNATTMCLRNDRFEVEVDWTDFEDVTGPGRVADFGNDESGLFWFFSQDNVEFLVKVLDGCGHNENFWVFASATTNVGYELRVRDTVTGLTETYTNPVGTLAPAITDTEAFASCDIPSDPLGPPFGPDPQWGQTDDCTPDDDTHCLQQGRFRVEVDWRDFDGNVGAGQVVPYGTDASGLFWFFSADNWEMLVKVLDGCSHNQKYWVFAAATTNVEYTLRVYDPVTQTEREYFNPLGQAADAIGDTGAFDCQ